VPFELDQQCVDGKHDFSPIVEGGQTVGIQCKDCPKTVRENMEQSNIIVTATGIENGPEFLVRSLRPRKDPRF
jgi:hypothetical protein